ncbi:MAG: transposase [Bacteroidetes bacterium]|nr:transposase [Bacteroidota bacterium]
MSCSPFLNSSIAGVSTIPIFATIYSLWAAWQTLQNFAADPKYLGAATGATMVLHTWGQSLSLHPHVHVIVPGGGINKQGKWQAPKRKSGFLFPVKAMSVVFRAIFMPGYT